MSFCNAGAFQSRVLTQHNTTLNIINTLVTMRGEKPLHEDKPIPQSIFIANTINVP